MPAEASYGFASFVIHVDWNSLSLGKRRVKKKSEAVHRLWELADSKEAIIFLSDCLFVYLSGEERMLVEDPNHNQAHQPQATYKPLSKSGNVRNRELTIIQRRILRRLRNKRRSIKRNLSQRENLNSNIKSQTTRKLSLYWWDLPISKMHRGRERTSYIPFLLNQETRSDVIPVRLRFSDTLPQARQPISHRRVCLNNGLVTITHFKVSHGDLISFKENDARKESITNERKIEPDPSLKESTLPSPKWFYFRLMLLLPAIGYASWLNWPDGLEFFFETVPAMISCLYYLRSEVKERRRPKVNVIERSEVRELAATKLLIRKVRSSSTSRYKRSEAKFSQRPLFGREARVATILPSIGCLRHLYYHWLFFLNGFLKAGAHAV
ncbi:ribosomal protein S4 [Striga asiatica]|uniref:Ribosomal protein S4 n=1 Tax=Striga asiatica TaxID=4170 RepID=A0A5A7R379_STRAF|nr:ribosomal protein S4 [Striga asiatica]